MRVLRERAVCNRDRKVKKLYTHGIQKTLSKRRDHQVQKPKRAKRTCSEKCLGSGNLSKSSLDAVMKGKASKTALGRKALEMRGREIHSCKGLVHERGGQG